jgi:hypothetical protein
VAETNTPNNAGDANFAAFLAAIRDYDADTGEPRTTAHSSSVTTADWERIQSSLRNADSR